MAFTKIFRRSQWDAPARALYERIVVQTRRPEFYARCGVPDSLDGRFDLLALHAFLVLHRLKRDHPEAAELAQRLFDTMFLDLDESLRELGAGDLGVGRRVKQMACALYGRIAAYEAGLAEQGSLPPALTRNLFGTVAPEPACVRAMADYMTREAVNLGRLPLAELMAGRVTFGPPVLPEEGQPTN